MTPVDSTPADDWRETAWNGVRLRVPARWEPREIGRRYLLLASPDGPAMELRWGPAAGRHADPADYLRRLQPRKGPRRLIRPIPLPAAWQKALTGFACQGFSWSAGGQAASGAVLCCPVCRQATLVQFFHPPGAGAGPTAAGVLSAFRDHGPAPTVVYALFDIRAEVPAIFQLAGQRFEAGYFELVFKGPRQRLVLHRWGPAGVLLQQTALATLGRRLLPGSDGRPEDLAIGPHQGLEWSQDPPQRGWQRWWGRLTPGERYRRYRIWHLPQRNRLLGVSLEGRLAPPYPWLDALCQAYESF
ncbi:MAG: hypothetical protein LJE63_05980 [Desulfobacteraceae bacterium]|jgi:hypothetical protein|nr:hypothetical protein [Desulfobacteraceae bacterium]